MRLFLVEDHIDIAENIVEFLEAEGHEVTMVMDGASAFVVLRGKAAEFAVCIVDVGLPRKDGLTLVRELREAGVLTPVLFLTARDGLDDKVAGFRAGGDDYLVKPFHMEELLVRIEALDRRQQQLTPAVAEQNTAITVDDLSIDPEAHRIERGGQAIHLNPSCFKLLLALAEASPKPLTHEALERCLWQGTVPESGGLRSSIYLLRKAIDRPFAAPLLHTVHGIGYRLGRTDA